MAEGQTVKPKSPIDAGISRLDGEIVQTREAIASLAGRLTSILSPSSPQPENPKETETANCDLEGTIISMARAAEENASCLSGIIDRLQI